MAVPSYLFAGPARDFSDPRDRRLRRALEIFPGALVWATLLGIPLISFFAPAVAAGFIIAFDVYWFASTIYVALFVVRSALKMRTHLRIDWMERLRTLPVAQIRVPEVSRWEDVIHLVILPTYREGPEIVGPAIASLAASTFPKEKLFVVLATEERAGDTAQRTASELRERYAASFGKFLVTIHPADIPGEIAGKGSNEAYAAQEALRKLIDPLGLAYERVVVSSFDSDTRTPSGYFACLTYHYLTAEKPLRSSFQPVPLYHNNIWEAPLFSRIAAIGSTVWQLFMQGQPDLLETFSSHSMPLRALVDAGFWNTRLVSEDSLIFAQCYLAFDGDYRVVSLFYPVSMDANVGRTFRATMASVYRQHRRWAYGVEKIPYAIFGFVKNTRIPLLERIRRGLRLVLGFWSWACAPFLILFLGWLPVMIGGEEFRQTVLAFNLPRWTRNLMMVATVGLFVNGGLTFLLLPPRPKGTPRWAYLSMVLQWLLLPFSFILTSAIPAIDAETRMMLGKYLGFWVTEKVRRRPGDDSTSAGT